MKSVTHQILDNGAVLSANAPYVSFQQSNMIPILCVFLVLIPIFAIPPLAIAGNLQHQTAILRGKIYLKVQSTAGAKCDRELITVSLKRVFKNPKSHSNQRNQEEYTYKNVGYSQNIIRGDIKRGYCEYIIRGIPKINGNYELRVDAKNSERNFPINAPACTVSPVYGEPKGWQNPITAANFNTNKDFELTRVIAKCDP